MFKFLKVGLLTVILALSFSVLAVAAEKSHVESIINYVKNAEPGEYGNLDIYRIESLDQNRIAVEMIILRFKENTSVGSDFWWTWTLHVVRMHYYKEWDKFRFQIIVRYYQDFSSPKAQGFEGWAISDTDLNGKISEYEKSNYCGRSFTIGQCYNNDDNCESNWIMFPQYPDGYINLDWHQPPLEEWQKKFDEEVNFWLEVLRKKEDISNE